MKWENWEELFSNIATIDYLLVKHNLGCQQLTRMCCLNIFDFMHTIDNQTDNLHKYAESLKQI